MNCLFLLPSLLLIFSVPVFDSFPPVHFFRFQLRCVISYWFLRSGNWYGERNDRVEFLVYANIFCQQTCCWSYSLPVYLFAGVHVLWSIFLKLKLIWNVSSKLIPVEWVNNIPPINQLLPHNKAFSIPQLSQVNNYRKGNIVLHSWRQRRNLANLLAQSKMHFYRWASLQCALNTWHEFKVALEMEDKKKQNDKQAVFLLVLLFLFHSLIGDISRCA